MNDLVTIERVTEIYPNFTEGFRKAAETFSKIQSFEDIETYLLRGQGLAAGTYKVYMVPVRQLYEFTKGLNPFQVTPGHIEAFYDYQCERVDLATCYNKIAGLKRFFSTIAKSFPGYVSPFDIMEPELEKKLKRTKSAGKKKALTIDDYKAVLTYLECRNDKQSVLLYTIIRFLTASGLRISEALALRWGDLEYDTDKGSWFCSGVGKGDKPFSQEIADPGVIDLLHELSSAPGWVFTLDGERMTPHSIWYQMNKLGMKLREKGIVTRKYQWSPHLFRRTAGTLLDKKGMSVVGIQNFLRHSNINTTVSHYIDNTESAAPYLAEALN